MALRVLIDTNVWVSAFLNHHGIPAEIIMTWLEDRIEIVISMPLLKEISDVLQRPRLQKKYKYTTKEIQNYLALIFERSRKVKPIGNVHLCRDIKDNVILETAILGKATHLVTRDDIKRDLELIRTMADSNITVTSVSNLLKTLK